MDYVALYRKYRPDTFDKVYGQRAVVESLRRQVINKTVGHAYLFSGGRGTGKTSVAKIFAKAINCKNPQNGNPCGKCTICSLIEASENIDIVEIDAASNNGVDNIRLLIEDTRYRPRDSKYKVFIIDEVHMLSQSAYNALLKTLEEPPPNVVFILATTEVRKVPATIYSRCQHHNFMMITPNAMKEAMRYILAQENQEYEEEALDYIVRLANGGLRDAVMLLDQVCSQQKDRISLQMVKDSFGTVEEDIVLSMVDAIKERDSGKAFEILNKQVSLGRDLSTFCSNLYAYYKDLFMMNQKDEDCQRAIEILGELDEKLQWNKSNILIEVAILKLCAPKVCDDVSAIAARLKEIEDALNQLKSTILTAGTPFSTSDMDKPTTASQPAVQAVNAISKAAPPVKVALNQREVRYRVRVVSPRPVVERTIII